MALLSIIVPIYNVEYFLEQCIKSILNQPFEDFELILVNDGSPDRCGEICNEYAILDDRIKVIHKSNGGLSSARNAGLDIANGTYISFIDSDDFISRDFYESNIQYLLNHDEVDMLVCQYCRFDSINNVLIINIPRILNTKKEIFEYLFSDQYVSSVWINIYKKEIFTGIRFPDGQIFEDGYILPDITNKLNSIYISNIGIYYYRVRANSIMASNRNYKQWIDILITFKKMLDYMHSNDITGKLFLKKYSICSISLLNAITQFPNESFEPYIHYFQGYKYPLLNCFIIKLPFTSRVRLFLLKLFGYRLTSNYYKFRITWKDKIKYWQVES